MLPTEWAPMACAWPCSATAFRRRAALVNALAAVAALASTAVIVGLLRA